MKSTNPRHSLVQITQMILKSRFFRIIKRSLASNLTPSNFTYEGSYKNFKQVLLKYNSNVGYLSKEYLISEANKVAEILKQSEGTYPGNERDHYLLLLLSSIPKSRIKILDVGSGFGLTFHYLNNKLGIKLDYTGIDFPEISEIALHYFGDYRNFYLSNLSELDGKKFDLVYFGSSLQYFEDYQKTLSQTLMNSTQLVLIADTPVGNLETFVTCQVNMKNRKIPRWIFSLLELNEILLAQKYELVDMTSVDWHNDIHNFSNFPSEYHHISHMNLLYRKVG